MKLLSKNVNLDENLTFRIRTIKISLALLEPCTPSKKVTKYIENPYESFLPLQYSAETLKRVIGVKKIILRQFVYIKNAHLRQIHTQTSFECHLWPKKHKENTVSAHENIKTLYDIFKGEGGKKMKKK